MLGDYNKATNNYRHISMTKKLMLVISRGSWLTVVECGWFPSGTQTLTCLSGGIASPSSVVL